MTPHERTTSIVGDVGPTDETSASASTATPVTAPTAERSVEVAA